MPNLLNNKIMEEKRDSLVDIASFIQLMYHTGNLIEHFATKYMFV